jgi:hypothetical protein
MISLGEKKRRNRRSPEASQVVDPAAKGNDDHVAEMQLMVGVGKCAGVRPEIGSNEAIGRFVRGLPKRATSQAASS